ncbi:CUB domain-containing protein 2 [Trichonephila clavata]|uniref:CUB domain-containing protein 2 n=1 Tax=Trichonephila clavata TaxID=2740835 RepID=A0A8X6KRR7_TRICU|nr:CUB domain-containing protein 2 [Trichonephila clavata]
MKQNFKKHKTYVPCPVYGNNIIPSYRASKSKMGWFVRKLVHYHIFTLLYSESVAQCFYDFDSNVSKVGNFTSPNFPKKYNANAICYYNFIGNDFETLKLDFEAFDLEEPYSKGCLTDYVDISTITASNVKELVGRYCGNKVDSPMLSMHPKAEIIFRSNHVIEGQGFFGMYEFKDESLIPPPNSTAGIIGCGGIVTGVGGTIVSPGYPQFFPKNIECVWLIRVDHHKHIYTRILELQLYGSIANCNDVELSIYDGYSSFSFNPEIIKKYCGDLKYYKNVEELTQMSKRNRLLVRSWKYISHLQLCENLTQFEIIRLHNKGRVETLCTWLKDFTSLLTFCVCLSKEREWEAVIFLVDYEGVKKSKKSDFSRCAGH